MASSLPSSSPPSSSSPARLPVIDPYAAISGSLAGALWQPPRFAKRDRSPDSPNSSPHHKRVRREDFDFPASSSPFGTRDLPATSSPFGTPPRYTAALPRSPRKETLYERQERIWSERISNVMDDVTENGIDLQDSGITFISPEIESLSKLVRLTSAITTSPSVSRAASLPANQLRQATTLQRVSTTAISLGNHAKPGMTPVQLFLSGNQIGLLPTELFRVENLTVLSLRNNRLKIIPPAIGALKNLTELSIGGNEIRHLPAEIDKIPLATLNLYPNKWLECPDVKAGDGKLLSPLATAFVVPSLTELCIRTLLSFPPGSSRTLVDEMDVPISGVPDHYFKYFRATCKNQWRIDPLITPALESSLGLEPSSPIRKRPEENDPQYDLSFSVCPNVEHGIGVKRSFIVPAEMQYRWVRKIGNAETGGPIPLLYRGCESGCLRFLEDMLAEGGEEEPGDDDDVVF